VISKIKPFRALEKIRQHPFFYHLGQRLDKLHDQQETMKLSRLEHEREDEFKTSIREGLYAKGRTAL